MAEDEGEKSRTQAALDRAAQRKAVLAKLAAKRAKLGASVDALLRSEEGREVFKFLFNVCGYAQADIPQDALRKIDSGVLLYNTTRRSIYVRLRELASPALLAPVEQAAEEEARTTSAPEETPT